MDPALKSEFDREVTKRAQELLLNEAAPQRKILFDEAKKEGYEQGLREGKAKSDEVCQRLNVLGESLVREKESLLRDHEKIWCDAIEYLMRRFLVPLSAERLQSLGDWIEESIGELAKEAKIQVALPCEVFAQVKDVVPPVKWEWTEDPSLKPTDLRVEIKGGGIFFSPDVQWQKFEAKLNEVFGVKAE